MKSDNYHQIRVAIDRALAVFTESAGQLSADDYQLKHDIEVIRSRIYRAESATPFPRNVPPVSTSGTAGDPDLTKAPWYKFPGKP